MLDATAEATKGLRIRQLFKTWGPAWLVMIADVDAASVITAAESGARHGTHLVWFLLVLTLPLFVIQEVAGRVGAVTRKGLGELIRENYSRRTAAFAAIPMALVDIISYVVEYTGIAIGFQILGVPPFISVPVVFIAHIILVYRRKYEQAEKPLLVVSILFIFSWVASAALTARKGIQVSPFYFSRSPEFVFLLAANVGAVIMPFMLFYQASATAEKGATARSLWGIRVETALGALVSELIMVAVAIASAGMNGRSLDFADPRALSQGLTAMAGRLAPTVFALGLIAASFIALIVISLGSCWGVTEALGWGRRNWFKVYLVESVPAVVVPLLSLNLINLALGLMVLQIIVLIGPAVILGMIATRPGLMGEHRLKGPYKGLYWAFLSLIFATGAVSAVLQLAGS